MRTKKSFINTVVAILSQIIIIGLGFLSRRVLIYSVGVQYLGINGLMTNILTLFSLAESGVGLAIGYALYKPLAEDDKETIKSLMHFYKIVYRVLAGGTAIIGVAFFPFLHFFLKGNTAPDVNIIYFLFLFSSVSSYLWSYKITLNTADQNKYVSTIADTVTQIAVLIIKVLVLYYTQNYVLFLSIDIGTTLAKNIILSHYVNRKYPYLKEKNVNKIESSIKNKLTSNIKSLFLTKIGYIISESSDNLVISSIINITTVGLYSNYTILVTSVRGFVNLFTSSITASVGNLIATEDKTYVYEVYKRIDFINYILYLFTSVCLFCLMEPFVKIWLGSEYILPKEILVLAVLLYYLKGINSSIDTSKNAAGLFRADRYITIIESIINIALSIILAKIYGLSGVLFGTVFSYITCSCWVRALYVFRDVFNVRFRDYILSTLKKIIVFVCVCTLIYLIQVQIHTDSSLTEFLLKSLVTVALSVGVIILLFFKTDEFKFVKGLICSIAKKAKSRLKHKSRL